ncbi:hypothetical protein ABZU25_02005 [Micromonospora sp. NPDC005215]|uniref:hypothetical protein n=1 Tax=Micromonospora sp. NPDC005215 TaxID=3157024 RepID=UPI0033BDC074
MTEQSGSEQQGGFPRRDAEGRVRTLGDLLGVCLAGLVIGALALVLFDWAFASIGAGDFGHTNGWLAVILPAWLFWDDFRAWEFGAARVVAAVVAAAVGVVVGLLIAGLGAGLPTLLSGTLAAGAFTVAYAMIWFPGVRWLTRRTG